MMTAAVMSACARQGAAPVPPDAFPWATITLRLGSPGLAGRSVRVTGHRVAGSGGHPTAAANGYRCLAAFTSNNCVDLSSTGMLSVGGLCPSPDAPTAVWDFEYELYPEPSCQGALLNPATNYAARCFDSTDLYSRAYPNGSKGKQVSPGANELAVACLMSPWRLAYVQRPTTTVAGNVIAPAVTIQVQDIFGEPLPVGGLAVSLSVASGPGPFSSSSTTTAVTDATGVATFANLVLETPGTYTLRAASGSLIPIDVNSFQVTPSPVSLLVYASTGTASTRNSTGTMTVVIPPGTLTNDLLLLVVVNASNLASTAPSGWTQLADAPSSSPKLFRLSVWWSLSNGSSTVDVTTQTNAEGASAWVVRYRRPSGYPPLPAPATSTVRVGTATPGVSFTPTPDVTTTQSNATVISVVAAREANPLSLLTAQGFNRVTSTTSSPGQGVALGLADLPVSVAGTTPPSPTWTRSGSAGQWAFATVAFY
jgi:hypothetical protein